MALSNWDTLAFNSKGLSSMGTFENPHGDFIEIYKNWAHIASPKMWRKNGSFCKPYIASINEGNMNICGFEIEAKRGPQNGIFLFAIIHEKTKKGKYKRNFFGAIGCYGFVNTVEVVLRALGREKDINDEDWCAGSSSGLNEPTTHYITNFKTREQIVYWDESKQGKYDYSADWVGVKKETLEEFFKWLESLENYTYGDDMKKWVARCRRSKKLRYNQGNAFFTAKIGLALEATKVGKAKTPTMLKIIGGMKKKK